MLKVIFLSLSSMLISPLLAAQPMSEAADAIEAGQPSVQQGAAVVLKDADRKMLESALRNEPALRTTRQKNGQPTVSSTCPHPVAASVYDEWKGYSGSNSLITFTLANTNIITNEGGALFGGFYGAPILGFRAPCDGLYYFRYSFVKDSYANAWPNSVDPNICSGLNGTDQDVKIALMKFDSSTGPSFINGNQESVIAWSGRGDGARGTGAEGVALQLNQDDRLYLLEIGAGAAPRCYARYSATLVLIAP